MDGKEFAYFRKKLSKTQKELAQLFGISLKAVQGYEQGWRSVPAHIERQLLFLMAISRENKKALKPCWVIKRCPSEQKRKCPAWEFRAGRLCWFINGTHCKGKVQKDWNEKMKICRTCKVFGLLLSH